MPACASLLAAAVMPDRGLQACGTALPTANSILSGALLYRADQPITLPRQVYKVLTYLLEHRGRLVSKDELSEKVWQRVIADATIEGCIKKCVGRSATPAVRNGPRIARLPPPPPPQTAQQTPARSAGAVQPLLPSSRGLLHAIIGPGSPEMVLTHEGRRKSYERSMKKPTFLDEFSYIS